MNNKLISIIFIGLVFLLIVVAPWWNSNWDKKRPVTLSYTGSALSNYQVKVVVSYDSDMQSDFDDIRFVDSDDSTELSYWRESYSAGSSAIFWVKVPSIPNGGKTIYLYYDNTEVSTTSNRDNTFFFFDDMEYALAGGSTTPLQGWTHDNVGSGTDEWEHGTPTNVGPSSSHSGSYCWGTDLNANYDNDGCSSPPCLTEWLKTPSISLTGNYPRLEFYDYQDIEFNTYDYSNLRLYDQDTGQWHTLQSFLSDSASWTYRTYDLSAYSGHTVQIRFEMYVDQYTDDPGWYIDDVKVRGYVSPEPTTSVGSEEVYCAPDGNSCSSDGDCCSGNCDTSDVNLCFSCTSCSGVNRCSNQETNECDAKCSGTSAQCDDVEVDTCPAQSYICADCSYQDRDNAESYCIDSTGCSGYDWNLGGEVSASSCCGDDNNEYVITETGGVDAPSGYDDGITTCCDALNDCTYDDTCIASGETSAPAIPNKAYCSVGTWLGGDDNSTACSAITGDSSNWLAGNWSGDANTLCCGDDSGENNRTKVCSGGACLSDPDDNACCDTSTDCVESHACYNDETNHPTLADIKCVSGAWQNTTGPSMAYEEGTLEDGGFYSGNVTINVSANTGNGVDTIVIYVNGSIERSCYVGATSGNCYLSKLFADGSYSFNASANDTFGNLEKVATRTVTIDTIAPTLTFNKPSADNLTLVGKWFQQNITVEDANLWWLNCSIYNASNYVWWSQEWNLTGMLNYVVTTVVDVVSWPLGFYYENCTVKDLTER